MNKLNKQNLLPSEVILDLVLRHADKIGVVGTAVVKDGSLMFAAKNHRGEFVMLSAPVHFDGAPTEGPPPRFVLFKLGPSVWKLSPSVANEKIHAYLTITGVPEPAPWEEAS